MKYELDDKIEVNLTVKQIASLMAAGVATLMVDDDSKVGRPMDDDLPAAISALSVAMLGFDATSKLQNELRNEEKHRE